MRRSRQTDSYGFRRPHIGVRDLTRFLFIIFIFLTVLKFTTILVLFPFFTFEVIIFLTFTIFTVKIIFVFLFAIFFFFTFGLGLFFGQLFGLFSGLSLLVFCFSFCTHFGG